MQSPYKRERITLLTEEYNCRAQRYWDWDEQLSHRTRFFAAAAITSQVFAHGLMRPVRKLLLAAPSVMRITALSRELAAYNEDLAKRLHNTVATSQNLDDDLVILEQNLVEDQIRRSSIQNVAATRAFLTEMDRLLDYGARFTERPPSQLSMYLTVLRNLAEQTVRSPRFRLLRDRVRIGQELIKAVRQSTTARTGLARPRTVPRSVPRPRDGALSATQYPERPA